MRQPRVRPGGASFAWKARVSMTAIYGLALVVPSGGCGLLRGNATAGVGR
jgi:hypothetical protein